jgi:hypothetical protein
MNNRLISCPSWLSKPERQVLLASVLCLLVLGLSAFSFAPSTHAASASSAHAASVQVSRSTSRLSLPQKTLSTTVANAWYRWNNEAGSCAIIGCWFWKLTVQGTGVRNPSIRQIWQWSVYCTSGGIAKITSCTYSGNGTRVITLIVQGRTAGIGHGALLEINYNDQIVRESTW